MGSSDPEPSVRRCGSHGYGRPHQHAQTEASPSWLHSHPASSSHVQSQAPVVSKESMVMQQPHWVKGTGAPEGGGGHGHGMESNRPEDRVW